MQGKNKQRNGMTLQWRKNKPKETLNIQRAFAQSMLVTPQVENTILKVKHTKENERERVTTV